MRRVFADTYYWIALLNDRDQGLPQAAIMTTQEVLSIAQRLSWFLGLQVPLPEVCQR